MTSREFRKWFDILYMPLSMYALRIMQDRDDAEEAVHEALASFWERFGEDESLANVKGYLYRSVYNECIAMLRRRHIEEDIEKVDIPDEEAEDTSFRDARVWEAIGKLPQKCREVFLASKRDGLRNVEIAEELGISVKTVENQMTKAYRLLRESLADFGSRKVFFLPFL